MHSYWKVLVLHWFILCSLQSFAQVTNIKVDQFGYRTTAEKIAVITQANQGFNAPENYTPATTLQVIDAATKDTVLQLNPQPWNNGAVHAQSGDKVWWLDFSALQAPGFYYILDEPNGKFSPIIRVGDDVYNEVLKQAVRMFYYQRCGVAKEATYAGEAWQDEACHIHSGQDLACRAVNNKSSAATEMDLSGGWHDAGDFNKYVTFTYSTLHNLLFAYENNPGAFFDNYNIPESGNGIPDIVDEIKYELDWLLKMQLENGSVLSKVSVTQHQGNSPASKDLANRYYAPATLSATRTFASVMAHAYRIFSQFSSMAEYANTLLTSAENAWQYIQSNPGYSTYDNSGFSSANPERTEYDQKAQELTAAYFLYEATGNNTYLTCFEENITHFHPLEWTYWYSFEYEYGRVLIDYVQNPDADPDLIQAITNSFNTSMQGSEFMGAINSETDAYRAFMKDQDYVWGSNKAKSSIGGLFHDFAQISADQSAKSLALAASEDYLHFFHGVNAHGLVMLSNMDEFGAENYCREMYHIWFSDGTEYDNADTSPKGPPPAFMMGGINQAFKPDAAYSGPVLEPPLNQPVQKAYKDWNTSWPENSWELTEPAIYYQAAYIHLLSHFANDNSDFATNYTELKIDLGITSTQTSISDQQVNLYPNPVNNGKVWIRPRDQFNLAELYDMTGKVIKQFMLENEAAYLDLQDVQPGMYLLKMINRESTQTNALIIE